MTDWNGLFKSIRISHEMTRADVVECCRFGGMEISGSKADGWQRGGVIRERRGGAEARGKPMTEEEFTAFVRGLPDWAARAYEEE